MESNDRYKAGKGMFGGPGGTYGRYGVSSSANNLSAQFVNAENVEEQQRRRFKRRHESGFVGNGYWFWNYPNMIGTLGAGSMIQGPADQNRGETTAPDTAGTGDTMGVGGTTFNGSDGGVS